MKRFLMYIHNFIFPAKIKEEKYFSNKTQEYNLPAIGAKINILGDVETQVDIGKICTIRKIDIPDNVDKKLVELDMSQYRLACSINTLPRKERAQKTQEYIEILLNMFKILLQECNSDVQQSKKVCQDIAVPLNKYLTDRGFQTTALPSNLSIKAGTGFVIWPVALLPSVTFIHKAQAQLIHLLTLQGWKILVVVGDCGKRSHQAVASDFIAQIKTILSKQKIEFEEESIFCLSDYYIKNTENFNSLTLSNIKPSLILDSFQAISCGLKWSQYSKFITKNYELSKQDQIMNRKLLSNIQPLLTWSLISAIVKNCEEQAIVIAGEDEKDQWDYISNNHANNKLGLIYIRELKKDKGITMDQEDLRINNLNDLKEKLSMGNMAPWLYTHFIELPKFLSKAKPSFCKLTGSNCIEHSHNCINCLWGENSNNYNNSDFDQNEFASTVYDISNPH